MESENKPNVFIITEDHVGCRVKLRNGDTELIIAYREPQTSGYPVKTSNGESCTPWGRTVLAREDDMDIVEVLV